MSYPRTPNNDGEYVEPDGRIRISRERYDRLVGATEPATRTQGLVKAALDSEFVTPVPQASLSREAFAALVQLIVEAAMGELDNRAFDASPVDAARIYLMNRLDVTTDGRAR